MCVDYNGLMLTTAYWFLHLGSVDTLKDQRHQFNLMFLSGKMKGFYVGVDPWGWHLNTLNK